LKIDNFSSIFLRFFFTLGFSILPLIKKFCFYKPNFFCLEIQIWFLKTVIFLKFELEKFQFLRTEFFIKDKIGFLGGKKEPWGAGREIF
jgi:hypothetical protein